MPKLSKAQRGVDDLAGCVSRLCDLVTVIASGTGQLTPEMTGEIELVQQIAYHCVSQQSLDQLAAIEAGTVLSDQVAPQATEG